MDYFKRIINLFTARDVSDSGKSAFHEWLIDKEHAEEKEQSLKYLWACTPSDASSDTRRSLERVKERIGVSYGKTLHNLLRRWQIAATVLLAVSASFVYLYLSNSSRDTSDLVEQYVPVAEMEYITLPDGSQVQLNSRSVLLYPKSFDGKSRSVYLAGEANFKVKSDAKRPFVVKSAGFRITVLGTEFDVFAYPGDANVRATVLSGSVKVEYDNLRSTVVLFPNQQWAYNKSTGQHHVYFPDMEDATAWQRGELVFKGTTLREIITVLERKYPYTFTYSLNKLKNDRFTFRFQKNASLTEVMDIVVRVVGDLQYRVEQDTIVIY